MTHPQLRILHVVRQFYPNVGGLENFVLSLALEQRRRGLDACVLTLDGPLRGATKTQWLHQDTVETIPVRRIPWTGSIRYPIALSALRHLDGYDLIHVHAVDFFADYLAVTAPVHRTPMVLSTHGGFFHTSFARRLKRLYFSTATRLSLKAYARIFAISPGDEQIFNRIAPGRVQRIDNGVDVEKFAAAASCTHQPTIVALGRIAAHKRLDLLIAAFEAAKHHVREAKLIIVGNDFDGSRALLEQRWPNLIASGAVTIKSDLDDAQVRRLFSHCSYIASASTYEGFGLGIVEGMSAGLIPLVSPIPSFTSIVGNSLGHVIDFADPQAAGNHLAKILQSGSLDYDAQRQRSMRTAQVYGWKHVAAKFISAYDDVLGIHERYILGVKILPFDSAQAITVIDNAIDAGSPLQVAFANANTLNIAVRRPEFRAALDHSLVLNDGIGADIASYLKYGRAFPANLNGTDFVPSYLDQTRHKLRIYLVGGRPGVIRDAARRFKARWPQHKIVGARDGYFKNDSSILATCEQIRDAHADVVLAGFGNPAQELWIERYARQTGARVLFGVGALFDFVAEAVPRAPLWVRNARCEWLFRLLVEPRRLMSRYLIGNAVFLVRAWRDRHHGARS
jgi:alpha-1,3-mannosyltransferase